MKYTPTWPTMSHVSILAFIQCAGHYRVFLYVCQPTFTFTHNALVIAVVNIQLYFALDASCCLLILIH